MTELKKQLLDICNASDLPLEAILFVTKDLWRDVEDTLRRVQTGLYQPTTASSTTPVDTDITTEIVEEAADGT